MGALAIFSFLSGFHVSGVRMRAISETAEQDCFAFEGGSWRGEVGAAQGASEGSLVQLPSKPRPFFAKAFAGDHLDNPG